MQDGEDNETSMNEVQNKVQESTKKIPVEARYSAPVQTVFGPTEPPIQRAPALFLGGKAAGAWR